MDERGFGKAKRGLTADVEKLKGSIITLKKEVEILLKQKAEIVSNINTTIEGRTNYPEKHQQNIRYWKNYNSMVDEAKAKSKEIIDAADAFKAQRKAEVDKLSKSADVLLTTAEKRFEEAKVSKSNLEKSIVDFNASKYAFETNIKSQKREADLALGKAVELQRELRNTKIKLDSRESLLNRRGEEIAEGVKKLEGVIAYSKEKTEELKEQEKSIIDQKTEILCLKSGNEDILQKARGEREGISKDIEANKKLLSEINEAKEEAEKQRKENASILDMIADERGKLSESKVSLHEKERLQKLQERQINEKISILRKLRAEEK